jgi:hypothetical protein
VQKKKGCALLIASALVMDGGINEKEGNEKLTKEELQGAKDIVEFKNEHPGD